MINISYPRQLCQTEFDTIRLESRHNVGIERIEMLGERLKALRTSLGYGRERFAQLSGIGESSIPPYEKNERMASAEVVARIALFFGVSADYLLGLSDDPASPIRDAKLTPEELKALALFRAASDENKEKIIGVLEIMANKSDHGSAGV